ncbi:MAG: alpha/beta fold hydrolase [Candidatus Nanopelagicales bacterium]|jgi:pimeloyl-ACP methyl ester carboxylesterase|nr:alpha/beta fold hydrolase [Candidatus Nanopelagicales bacterium]
MHVILLHGFWLDGSSWDPVLPALEAAGHRPHPLTLVGADGRDPSRITLRDQVEAVLALVDSLDPADGPVVLVGHSGGGAVAHAVADARPDRVARVVYLASEPVGDGDCINDGLPEVDGLVPLPDWSVFDDEMVADLDEGQRETFRARAIPVPVGVARGRQQLGDERRYDVPITMICCEFTAAMIRGWVEQGHPGAAELARIREVTYVDLPAGHWPQISRPADVGRVLAEAIGG